MITIGRAPQLLAAAAAIVAAFLCAAQPAAAQYTQGPELIGGGYLGTNIEEGRSVAMSADGNTVVIGGPFDNSNVGAAWVYIRSGGGWSEQAKLVANDAIGSATQGYSVALSADGNTLIVGGPDDNDTVGAAWVFTRSGGAWTEQAKLVAGDAVDADQGRSVALSADGNTAIVGGPQDYAGNYDTAGAAWVFTRSGGVWTEQQKLVGTGADPHGNQQGTSVALSADGATSIVGGPGGGEGGAAWVFTQSGGVWDQQSMLVGSDSVLNASQGTSVALSGDGSTAIVGGPMDNSYAGAAWIFTQSGGVWTQQGSKLVADDAVGHAQQGSSVALSADGETAFIGGPSDNTLTGAVWVFNQSGGVWSERAKLVGSGNVGRSDQGSSVALSANGDIMIEGGPGDNSYIGAAWIYVRTSAHDFNLDGVSDILWRDTSNDVAMWLMSAGQESSGATLGNAGGSWSVVGQRDFNGDGNADLLWLDQSGDLGLWLMNGASVGAQIGLGNVGASWSVVGTGDFNGDGTGDILWRDGSGDLAIWLMSNGKFSSGASLGQVASDWSVAGTGDFNGDGTTDILWRNTATGDLAIWFMSNGRVSSAVDVTNVPLAWSVAGTGDFDGDGTSDILWRDASGDYAIWLMNNGKFASGATIASGVPNAWSVAETGDFDGDGKSDILWSDTSGDVGVWLMNGTSVSSANGLGNVGTTWTVQGQNAD